MRHRHWSRLRALGFAGIFGACASESAPPPNVVVRDSAGVQIVENTSSVWGDSAAWRLSEQPIVDIGAVEGDPAYELFGVRGALRLPNGRIVVANNGSGELRFYDPRGRHLFTTGRKGGGPGEFEGMGAPRFLAPDSLVVQDFALGRISVLTDRGVFVRSFFTGDTERRYIAMGHFADGSLLIAGGISFAGGLSGTGVLRDSMLYVRRRSDGSLMDTVGMLPWRDLLVSFNNATGGRTVTGITFGKVAQSAVGPDYFHFGTADTSAFVVLGQNGDLRRIIRFPGTTQLLTQRDHDRYIDESLERMEERSRRFWRNRYRITPFPKTAPAYGRFVLDAEWNLWVEAYRRPWDTQSTFRIFDSEGTLLGQLTMPDGFEVYQIGIDFVLGGWKDELDIEHVLVYGLSH